MVNAPINVELIVLNVWILTANYVRKELFGQVSFVLIIAPWVHSLSMEFVFVILASYIKDSVSIVALLATQRLMGCVSNVMLVVLIVMEIL